MHERPKPVLLTMKKQIILATFSALSFGAFAQQAPSFGIRGGTSIATLKGDATSSLNSVLDYTNGAVSEAYRTGFYGGTYVNIPLGHGISVEPALYYAQKGYELKGELGIKGAEFIGANAKARLTTHYIDLPVVLKADLGGLQLFAGPQVSYLASAGLRTTAGVLGFNLLNKKMDATQQFNRWDAGITGGVGYQFANGVNISAAYDHGLSRVDAGQNMNAYNRSVKVGLGFTF
jgi:hypothetical protein